MMHDKRRGADGGVSIGEMKLHIRVELLIPQGRQVIQGPLADLLLKEPGIRDGRELGRIAIDIANPLQRVNPESFAVKDMDHLVPQRGEAEFGQFPADSRQMELWTGDRAGD